MALLADIQSSLLDGGELAPILLKLRFLAARLGSDAMEEWVRFEAEGYPAGVEVPPYRQFPISYTASFQGPFGSSMSNAPIPSIIIEDLAGAVWLAHPERQGTGAIEALIASTAKSGSNLTVDASNLIIALGSRVYEGMACREVKGSIPRGALIGMLETLRARVLDLTLELEKSIPGVAEIEIAQGAKFSEAKDYATVTNNITHNTVYGNQNTTSISNSGDGARIAVNIQQGDVESLTSALREIGLEDGDARELAAIVASEKPEGGKESLGSKAKAWVLANVGKVASKISIAVAVNLITAAVAKFYGG